MPDVKDPKKLVSIYFFSSKPSSSRRHTYILFLLLNPSDILRYLCTCEWPSTVGNIANSMGAKKNKYISTKWVSILLLFFLHLQTLQLFSKTTIIVCDFNIYDLPTYKNGICIALHYFGFLLYTTFACVKYLCDFFLYRP